MKTLLLLVLSCLFLNVQAQENDSAANIFIITTDGFRWQEIFNGADDALLTNQKFVSDTALIKDLYWDADTAARRSKLMPFMWNVIAKKGQLYGNKQVGNRMTVKNIYKFSYPGYNEIFTGYADLKFTPNKPVENTNTNILEFLNKQPAYHNKVVAFTSWNILPFILNEKRSEISINGGYEKVAETNGSNAVFSLINQVQDEVHDKESTRYDELTFLAAKEYIKQQHPKVAFIGFGETDEFAHSSKYDEYLHAANRVDNMIAQLWYLVQSDPFYKNNTTFIITTDHGRGNKTSTWNQHHTFIKGSGDIWMALLGPNISPIGEMKKPQHLYQKQIAATIAMILGKTFEAEHSVAASINVPFNTTTTNTTNGNSTNSTVQASHSIK